MPTTSIAMYTFFKRLQFVSFKLKWNHSSFGNIFQIKKHLQDKLEGITFYIKDEGMTEELLWEESIFSK